MSFKCTHCGKCCLTIPCIFAQIKYKIERGDNKVCPELKKIGDHYECELIKRDAMVAEMLLSGDCDDPTKAHLKKQWDAVPIVKEYFPNASDKEAEAILWNETSFPEFWNIPDDGWTGQQCLRTELGKLVKTRSK